jgi:hypothetical protein
MDADDMQNPAVPSGIDGVKSIMASTNQALALKEDGSVLAWGPNYEGENDIPENLGKVTKLSAGNSSVYALLADGTVRSWGNVKNGENHLPAELKKAMDISTGQFICRFALDSAGRIFTWGDNACDKDLPH